jgi:hypothetical protein
MNTTLEDITIARVADLTDTPEWQLRTHPEFCRLLDEGADLDHLTDWAMEAYFQGQFD